MSELRTFAGIGSRNTPVEILEEMKNIAKHLESLGFKGVSGGATGADTAFEDGMKEENFKVFYASDATKEAMDEAAKRHPAWAMCDPFIRKLHGRNAMILLGENLDKPVEFVLCWTPGGKVTGGTGQSIRIARHHKIPIINMYNRAWLTELDLLLKMVDLADLVGVDLQAEL